MTLQKARFRTIRLALGATALTLLGTAAQADFVINDDLIVDGSACIGFDCVNGESFGFDTLRLKENNTRIKFDDTSNSASFPRNKWELTANETTNGGAEKFSITDVTNSRIPFTIRGTAPNNSIFVATNGNVGLETGSPVVELHIADGDTPTIRLEQNGTSGFTPQTWDMAGNETNYFIRDVSNGSLLPFRIRPGAATSSVDIENDGDVRIGHGSVTAFQTDILQNSGTSVLRLATTSGGAILQMNPNNDATFWNMTAAADNSQINFNVNDGAGDVEMVLTDAGNLTIAGQLITTGPQCAAGTPCDAVFDSSAYTVPSIEEHAAVMWENGYLPAVGPTASDMPMNLTERFGNLLNELEHAHIYIEQLNAELKTQSAENEALVAALSARLERLEAAE